MAKEKKEPASVEGESLLFHHVYCVCFPQRDSLDALHGELAAARKRFFSGGRKAVKVGRHEIVKGFEGDLRGKISRWGFYWKKTALGVAGQRDIALEQAFDQKNGYVLVNRDFRGLIVSRVFFDKEHAWQKSEYYEPWDPVTAKVMFKPDPMEDVIGRYDWDPDKKLYQSMNLYPAPYDGGSAEQALINARFGEPQLIVAMGDEQFCYCPQKEAQARAQALEEISSGTMVLMPAWEIKEGAFLGEEDEEDTSVTFTSLEEYARIEKKAEKPAPEPALPAPPPPLPVQPVQIVQAEAAESPESEPEPEPEYTPLPEEPAQPDELDIEFILADARPTEPEPEPEPEPELEPEPQPFPLQEPAEEVPPLQPEDGSAVLPFVREAMEQNQMEEAPPQEEYEEDSPYEPEEPAPLPPARHSGYREPPRRAMEGPSPRAGLGAEDTSILSAARQASGAAAPRRASHGGPARAGLGAEDASILSAARQAGGGQPPRRAANAQRPPQRNGGPGPRHTSPGQAAPPPSPQQRAQKPVPAAGSDRMRMEKRTGKGRSEQPGGLTAYEGDYKDGKRQGFGSHYYKNGDLSYAGFWRDDKKDGLGVSFREGDHALHVSRWVQGRPGQQVSLFDKDGGLRFGGRIVGGKKEGAGVSISSADGSVLVTKWADGQNTGLASAFDPEGNLLYYGGWKNGKRHGHGTEFDANGAIVFDGEWRDDQYFNGILYQKPAEDPQPADPDFTEPDWEM